MFDSHISQGSSDLMAYADRGVYLSTAVFPSQRRFETGIVRMLKAGSGRCAVLHVAARSDHGVISGRMLNLIGNTLRVCMRGGAVAYLGGAEYAVLLQDCDARAAADYARTVIGIVSGFRVLWGGELCSAQAHVGGIMAGTRRDSAALFKEAVAAGEIALTKPGRLHLLHAQDEGMQRADGAECSSDREPAFV